MGGENEVEVIEISSSSPCDKKTKKVFVNGLASPEKIDDSDGDGETPVTHILCLKNADDLERFEKTEDCFIIDFKPVDLTKLFVSAASDDEDAPELSLLCEKGQVACRDYPHSRHLCLKFPFDSTIHESHCDLCYCYVCDSPAPCSSWTATGWAHCDASHGGEWKEMRKLRREKLAKPLIH